MNHYHEKTRRHSALLIALAWLVIYGGSLVFQPVPAAPKIKARRRPQEQSEQIVNGGKLFNPTCSSAYCHGTNGAGGGAPSLRDRNFTAEYMTRVISEGVPGTAMPAFKNQLTQEQIQQLVAYVMTFSKGAVALNKSASHEKRRRDPHAGPAPKIKPRLAGPCQR